MDDGYLPPPVVDLPSKLQYLLILPLFKSKSKILLLSFKIPLYCFRLLKDKKCVYALTNCVL